VSLPACRQEPRGLILFLRARLELGDLPLLSCTAKLIETAIKLYDSQLSHSRWWTFLMPLAGSFVGAIAAIFIAKYL
jgi:hypothetical protein